MKDEKKLAKDLAKSAWDNLAPGPAKFAADVVEKVDDYLTEKKKGQKKLTDF